MNKTSEVTGELTAEEIQAAKEHGVEIKQYWAVAHNSGQTPLAIFEIKAWAEVWRDKYLNNGIVEPYAMQIK